jgi:hypothetical protein
MVDAELPSSIQAGDTVEISFTTKTGVHIRPTRGIVTKTILHDVDGTPVRYYHVDVPNASAVHPILPSILEWLTDTEVTLIHPINETAPPPEVQWHSSLASMTYPPLNAIIDNGATFGTINQLGYFTPGTVRPSTITAHFNSHTAQSRCDSSDIVGIQGLDGRIINLRFHYDPAARRTLVPEGLLISLGFRRRDNDTHAVFYDNDTPVLRFLLPPPKPAEVLDSDNYVTPLTHGNDKGK